MKKQKLLFFPLLLYIIIGLLSCNGIGNSGNTTTVPNTLAVVSYDMTKGSYMIGTIYGYLAAPELMDCSSGDCLLIQQFTIDYDNQPSEKYITATNIIKEIMDCSYMTSSYSLENNDYTFAMTDLLGYTNVCYDGKFFIWAMCKDINPEFRLVYNSEEEEINGIKNLYLLAKPSSSTPSSNDSYIFHAFDMNNWFYQYCRDTTIVENGGKFDLKYVSINLKYISGTTYEGKPEYKTVNPEYEPFNIYTFR